MSTPGPSVIRGNESSKAPQRRKPGRVPTACAECRRLKLRCNRQVPCEKCESRGCAAICPDGVLTPGRGNRLVLANTEELHDQINSMGTRIRKLERALRDLQYSVSSEPHPLLHNDLLLPSSGQPTPTPPPQVPSQLSLTPSSDQSLQEQDQSQPSKSSNISRQPTGPQSMQVDDEVEDVVDACGTLISTSNGGYIHLGSTARPEYLMRIPSQIRPTLDFSSTSRLSRRIVNTTFFDSDLQELDDNLGMEIYSFLPSLTEADVLCQVYLEHATYLYIGLSMQELYELLPLVYQAGSFGGLRCADTLSLLFITFALGTLFSPQPDSVRAQEYFYLSRAALSLSSSRCGITLVYIQAVVHMTQYLDLSNPGLSHSTSVWLYAGYAARLGQDIALQMHNARWEMPTETVLLRCHMFWRVFFLDTWTSFYYGRPLIMSPPFIDSPFCKDLPSENPTMSYDLWNGKFASLVHTVITVAFGPKNVPYSSIIELDRRIRDFYVPSAWKFQCLQETPDTNYELRMRRYFVCARKEIVLLSLHRPYLVQVLSTKSAELERHRYRASVMACYRSAWRLIQFTRLTYQREPQRTSRISLIWSHCLSSIVIMSLVVTHAPKGPMALAALHELEVAAELFKTAAPTCQPAANLLETVHKLLQTAKEAAGQLSISRVGEQEVDHYPPRELERLAGKSIHLHDVTGWSLNGPSMRNSSNTNEQWKRLGALEEDPFQILMDLMVQQYQQPNGDKRPAPHGLDCLHTVLEQDLKDLELGKAFVNMKGITDNPSLKPHPPPPMPSMISQPAPASTSTTSNQNATSGAVESGNSDPSTSGFGDNTQLMSGYFGLGFDTPQHGGQSEHLNQVSSSVGGIGNMGGLFGNNNNALLTLDPSLQTIAEHLGFYSNSLSYNPYFSSISY